MRACVKITSMSVYSLISYPMLNMANDTKACFLSKLEHSALICYLLLNGKADKEIHNELIDIYIYSSSASSYAQNVWGGKFKRGRTFLEYDLPFIACVTYLS